MTDLATIATNLAWPVTMLVAWLAGEYWHRWTGLPRIIMLRGGKLFTPPLKQFDPLILSTSPNKVSQHDFRPVSR